MNHETKIEIARGRTVDFDRLAELWQRSVRASHDFLEPSDIDELRPLVRTEALPGLELWTARVKEAVFAGFIGLDGNCVEALFIDSPYFGRGIGRAPLDHAQGLRGRLKVDVNEQNTGAHAFYLNYGFVETGRSPTDSAGRPFPLIHMEMSI